MEAHRTGRSVRLDTLVRLRWLAVIGQTTAVLVVYSGSTTSCRSGPAWRSSRFPPGSTSRCAFASLRRSDSSPIGRPGCSPSTSRELAALLFFTGGLQNPFAFLFLGPVLISATALPPRMTLMLGGFAMTCATVLIFVH